MAQVARDSRTAPLPGDTLRASNGHTYHVLDRFVSVTDSGTETRGVFCSVETDDGDERACCMALSVFANKARGAQVLHQAADEGSDWQRVPRYPLAELEPALRSAHGYD